MINTAVAKERVVITTAAKKLTSTELTIKSNDNKSKSVSESISYAINTNTIIII